MLASTSTDEAFRTRAESVRSHKSRQDDRFGLGGSKDSPFLSLSSKVRHSFRFSRTDGVAPSSDQDANVPNAMNVVELEGGRRGLALFRKGGTVAKAAHVMNLTVQAMHQAYPLTHSLTLSLYPCTVARAETHQGTRNYTLDRGE